VPRAEDRAHETADNPSPLHQPGNLHALANRRPRHQRTAFPPAREDPQGPNGRAGKSTLTSAAIVKPNAHHWRLPQKGSPAHLSRYSSENRASQAGRRRNPELELHGSAHSLLPREMFNHAIPFHIADSIYCDIKCRIENEKRRTKWRRG
jgi:hypothetical protein